MSARRLTTALTLLVLLIVLGGMAVFGYRALTSPLPGGQSADKQCSDAEKQVQAFLKRSEIQVSVFNAGTREGFAGTTLEKVEEAGFRGGNAGNAPKSTKVRRAVVWTTEPDDSAAKLVALAFGRRTHVEVTESDLGPGIDVLVGDRFKGLDPKAPARIRLPAPVETCVPVD
ncbi:MAG: LytR family transcriptional regulator [Marmoricola sp.]|nr:LytR family transcriptional regulator [Marmoricola sp.]